MEELNHGLGGKPLSVLKDPFLKNKITEVCTFMFHLNTTKPVIMGHIKFQNGNTNGQQDFTGNDFEELVDKMDAFVKTLD